MFTSAARADGKHVSVQRRPAPTLRITRKRVFLRSRCDAQRLRCRVFVRGGSACALNLKRARSFDNLPASKAPKWGTRAGRVRVTALCLVVTAFWLRRALERHTR